MIPTPQDGRSLSGVRVVDLTRALAGPFCTRIMADMGAEIIKIEPPGGDVARQFEYTTPEGVSGYFMQQNCGKKDLCLDLQDPDAVETVKRLVEVSDVVLENFRPGVMDRLGLAYQELCGVNPALIMCSISAFGQEGPYAQRRAGDMVVQSMSGIASLTGDPDGPPQTVGMALSDTTGGLHAFGAICAALYRRSLTGFGQYIELALVDCVLWQNEWASQYLLLSKGEEVPARYGNRRPILIPGNLFRGRDGWVTIVASTDPGWQNLTEAMGMPALAGDPRFSDREARMANRDELEALVEEWVGTFDSVREVEELLADRGAVMCGWVRTWREMLEDPHTEQRGLIARVQDPLMGDTPVMNSPFRLQGAEAGVSGPAPMLGQHTRDILQGLLGYPDDKVLDMVNANVLHADERVMAALVEGLLSG